MEKNQALNKKKRLYIIIGSILVLLACLCIAIIGVTYFLIFNPNSKASSLIKTAEAHINQTRKILERTSTSSNKVAKSANAESLKKAVKDFNRLAALANSHVSLAKKALKEIDTINASNSIKRKASLKLEAAIAFELGLQLFKDWANELDNIAGFLASYAPGLETQEQATNLLNKAIDEANANNYPDARKDANQALTSFRQTKNLYAKANNINDKDFADYIRVVDYYIEATKLAIKMANTEKTKVSQYNALVDQLNKTTSTASTLKAKNTFAKNPKKWVESKLEGLLNQAIDALRKADELNNKANKL